MKMKQRSETSAYKIQTPGSHPKESIQHSGHGESLKSRSLRLVCIYVCSHVSIYDIYIIYIHSYANVSLCRSRNHMEKWFHLFLI